MIQKPNHLNPPELKVRNVSLIFDSENEKSFLCYVFDVIFEVVGLRSEEDFRVHDSNWVLILVDFVFLEISFLDSENRCSDQKVFIFELGIGS